MIDRKKTIVLIGATGLIGRQILKALIDKGYIPLVLSRNLSKVKKTFTSDVNVEHWNSNDVDALKLLINGSAAIINLAGESIASRWTATKKDAILKSRVLTTNAIVLAIQQCTIPPKVFIQSSAIGFYSCNSFLPTDENGLQGAGFLSDVVKQWEQAAVKVERKSRLIIIRTGVVISAEGGFLRKIITPIKLFIGGWFGDGSQELSWIHIKDHVKAVCFLLENDNCSGVYNLVSPNPINIKLFVRRVGLILKRPVWLPIPAFVLKLIFGKMADEVILANQNIIPERLIQSGFKFEFDNAKTALEDLLI